MTAGAVEPVAAVEEVASVGGTCPFCTHALEGLVSACGTVAVLEDAFPVTPGHHLVVPFRHVTDFFGLTDDERRDVDKAIIALRDELQSADRSITGFNIGINCGTAAGQTVFHAHFHVIPRRRGDVDDPTGGVRGVIPERRRY